MHRPTSSSAQRAVWRSVEACDAVVLCGETRHLVLERRKRTDVPSNERFQQLLLELRRQRWTVLHVSHDLDMVRRSSDQVLCLNRRLCCSGPRQHPDAGDCLSCTVPTSFPTGISAMVDTSSLMLVLAEPIMQRALVGGLLTGALGGVLGSVAVLRQLSFFSDALGHSALLGITLGILIGVNPTLVLIPFAILFAILVNQLVERSSLPTDALLNIVYSSSLAAAILALSFVEHYRGGIRQLLFGDILGVSNLDLVVVAVLLAAAVAYLGLSLRAQVLLTLNAELAGAVGVRTGWHRLAFIVLLAVVVAVSIKAVGVLLISAFVVIPACAGRLLCRRFPYYISASAILGGSCALLGLLVSGLTNLPSGPSVVMVQFLGFVVALLLSSRLFRGPANRPNLGRIPGAGPADL